MVHMRVLADDLNKKRFTFDDLASLLSDDKDTKNNRGLMFNNAESGRTSRFEMKDLPTEVARQIEKLDVDSVSQPFTMVNSRGKTVCAVVKLKSRTPAHRATIQEDFQVLSNVVLNKRREEKVREWVKNKIKSTYVKMDDRYKNCDFEYEGWVR